VIESGDVLLVLANNEDLTVFQRSLANLRKEDQA
jgi:hypothetical protein